MFLILLLFSVWSTICEYVRNGPWGLVVRTPAARDLAGGVSETYYERNVHPGGRPWTGLALGRVTQWYEKNTVNICSQRA